ncbi:MAG: hypothetical protein MRQ13_03570 [Candidatus Midichloria sp.]|nr:hypothetical protein [Candidatus Midichloria sp.]
MFYIDQFSDCMSISDIMTKLYGEAGRWVTNVASLMLSVSGYWYYCNKVTL